MKPCVCSAWLPLWVCTCAEATFGSTGTNGSKAGQNMQSERELSSRPAPRWANQLHNVCVWSNNRGEISVEPLNKPWKIHRLRTKPESTWRVGFGASYLRIKSTIKLSTLLLRPRSRTEKLGAGLGKYLNYKKKNRPIRDAINCKRNVSHVSKCSA